MAGYNVERKEIIYHSSKNVSSRELKSVTPEMANAWSETFLPTLLSNYDLPAEVRKVLWGKAK